MEFVFPAELRYSRVQLVTATEDILQRIRALPGVRSAAMATENPFDNHYNMQASVPGGSGGVFACLKPASPHYFETLRIPLVKGRDFSQSDMEKYTGNCIVDRHTASLLWPGADPVGRTLALPGFPAPLTVIGVVGAVNYYSHLKTNVYIPIQTFWTDKTVQLYSHIYIGFSADLGGRSLQAVVHDVTPQAFTASPVSLESWVGRYLLLPRLGARLADPLALLTAFLSGLGAFGIIAYMSTAKTVEIAIRISCGARRADVVSVFARFLLLPAFVGMASGIALAIGSSPVWKQALRTSVIFDWRILAVSLILIVTVIVTAAFAPIRRVTHVDPGVVLKAM